MKKFLLGTVGLVALGMAAPATAADMAARPYTKAAPVYVDPTYNWSGFYIGINGGWGSSRNRYEWTGPLGVTALGYSADATGGLFGGQIGYNWQAGSWVFGLEAQYDWADLNRAHFGPPGTWSVGSKVDALGFFMGRMERREFRLGIQYALGWYGRRWLGIRLHPELVVRRRIHARLAGQQRLQ